MFRGVRTEALGAGAGEHEVERPTSTRAHVMPDLTAANLARNRREPPEKTHGFAFRQGFG